MFGTGYPSQNAIIDCRDDIYDDMYNMDEALYYYKVGYDGFDVTIDGDPQNTSVWGEGTGYHIVPSFVCPAQMIANIVVSELLINRLSSSVPSLHNPPTYPVDGSNKLKGPVTFNTSSILDLISKP